MYINLLIEFVIPKQKIFILQTKVTVSDVYDTAKKEDKEKHFEIRKMTKTVEKVDILATKKKQLKDIQFLYIKL